MITTNGVLRHKQNTRRNDSHRRHAASCDKQILPFSLSCLFVSGNLLLSFLNTSGIRPASAGTIAQSRIPPGECNDDKRKQYGQKNAQQFLCSVHPTEQKMVNQTACALVCATLRKQIADLAISKTQQCKHRTIHQSVRSPLDASPDDHQRKQRYNKRKHPHTGKQVCPLLQHRCAKQILQIGHHTVTVYIAPSCHT